MFQKFLEWGASSGFIPRATILEDLLNLVAVFLNELKRHFFIKPYSFPFGRSIDQHHRDIMEMLIHGHDGKVVLDCERGDQDIG